MDVPDDSPGPTPNDDRLGMNEPISRRDFVNGALVAGAGMLLNGRASAMGSPPPTHGMATAALATTAARTATPTTS